MSLDDWHLIFVSICLVIITAACAPLVIASIPIRDERFLTLAILGYEGMAERYFPDNDPNIEVGERVDWIIYLFNQMGEIQYITLKIKLLNSTMLAPNSSSNNPSIAPVVYEVRRILFNNETWLFPFSWAVLSVVQNGDVIDITSLSVNDEIVDTRISALNGANYRIVVELWVYNEDLRDFKFGWVYGDDTYCAWNQVWFNSSNVYTS